MKNNPKRRKSKDNPYTIYYDEQVDKYFVSFKDGQGVIQHFEIEKLVYDVFDSFEREDLSELNEYDRHIEHSELDEHSLHVKAVNKDKSIEDMFIDTVTYETVLKAIEALPPVQKRRFKMYYFAGLTYEQIAKKEGCSFQAVGASMLKSDKNILK